jgi:biopolymer transport protein ExbD
VQDLLEEEDLSLPMTPMIDIVFQLLIFFLLASTIAEEEVDLQIRLASGDQGAVRGAAAGTHLIIGVRKDGSLTLSGRPIELTELQKKLEAVGRGREKPQVFVRGDRDAPYGRVAQVYQICVRANLPNVAASFLFEPTAPAPPNP